MNVIYMSAEDEPGVQAPFFLAVREEEAQGKRGRKLREHGILLFDQLRDPIFRYLLYHLGLDADVDDEVIEERFRPVALHKAGLDSARDAMHPPDRHGLMARYTCTRLDQLILESRHDLARLVADHMTGLKEQMLVERTVLSLALSSPSEPQADGVAATTAEWRTAFARLDAVLTVLSRQSEILGVCP